MSFRQLIDKLSPNTKVRVVALEGESREAMAIEFAIAIEKGDFNDFEVEYIVANLGRLIVYATCEME